MEAHECIFMCVVELILDGFSIHISWYGVVDIKKSNSIHRYACTDELTECSVDIYFTRYRDAHTCETAVYVARYETELCLECRPALTSDCNIFSVTLVSFNPVKKSKFVLSKFRKDFRLHVTSAKFFFHLFNLCRNTRVICMFVESFEQVKFGVFFDFNAKVVKLLNRSITSKEVEWSRTKADDLEIGKTNKSSSDWKELVKHISTLLSITYRILWDVSFNATEFQVVASVEHTAVSIATAIHKVVLAFFCCCDEHSWAIEMFSKKCFTDFRTKVSKVYAKSVTSCFLDIFKSLNHVNFTFYDTDWAFINAFCSIFFCVSIHQRFSSVNGQRLWEAVTANCNHADFNFWHVKHNLYPPYFIPPLRGNVSINYSKSSVRQRFLPLSPKKLPSAKPPSS